MSVVFIDELDLARYIVEYNGRLAFEMEEISSPLDVLALSSSSFPSGMKFNLWQSFLYYCVPEKLLMRDSISLVRNHFSTSSTPTHENRFKKLYACFWMVLEVIVYPMKSIRHEKAKHFHAIELVELLCEKISSNEDEALFKDPLLHGATNGIFEVMEEIRDWCRSSRNFEDEQGHNFFELGVINRHGMILRVLEDYQDRVHILNRLDGEDNNILHLVGRQPQYDDFGSGAVFKMQLELQWFEELASIYPELKTRLNKDRKTPLMVFNEEHSEMAKNELARINSMATSCSVAASIIATVAFAAAITVPGGNNSNGLPNFSSKNSFTIFIISDALAVVSSVTTLVSFLSIFTSQYVVNDFIYAIPNRVILGLISLIFSIVFLMVAFGSTMVLIEATHRPFVLLPIVLVSCVPVLIFVLLQVPTLLKMMASTYGPSIFK